MPRLIDADALPRHGKRGGLVHWKDIENAPTVDNTALVTYLINHMTYVVRCRDCKWWNGNEESCNGKLARADDYCSWGERKDNG